MTLIHEPSALPPSHLRSILLFLSLSLLEKYTTYPFIFFALRQWSDLTAQFALSKEQNPPFSTCASNHNIRPHFNGKICYQNGFYSFVSCHHEHCEFCQKQCRKLSHYQMQASPVVVTSGGSWNHNGCQVTIQQPCPFLDNSRCPFFRITSPSFKKILSGQKC